MERELDERSKTLGKRKAVEDERESEGEVEKLEAEWSEMSRKISEYRKSIPDLLVKAVRSKLLAQRPQIDVSSSIKINTSEEVSENQKRLMEKLNILRENNERNIASLPAVRKRMNECVARIIKLKECHVNVDPIFRK